MSAAGYTVDGNWYPRVTSIVAMKAKPGLYKFYAEQESFEAGEAIKAKSAEEGTLMHETVEAILGGQSPVIPQSIKPAVTAFYNFLDHQSVKALSIEERIVSRWHGYSGTLDVVADIGGQAGVLDIKTSYSVFRDYGLQTAAYVEALHEKHPSFAKASAGKSPPLTRWILRLDQYQNCLDCSAILRTKGGNAKIRKGNLKCPHRWGEVVGEAELKELPNHQGDFRAFLACKVLWEWEHEFWLSRLRR